MENDAYLSYRARNANALRTSHYRRLIDTTARYSSYYVVFFANTPIKQVCLMYISYPQPMGLFRAISQLYCMTER